MTPLDPSKLGHKQQSAYKLLCKHGFWNRHSGWTFGPTGYSTAKMLDSLVLRGFATIVRVSGIRTYKPIRGE